MYSNKLNELAFQNAGGRRDRDDSTEHFAAVDDPSDDLGG